MTCQKEHCDFYRYRDSYCTFLPNADMSKIQCNHGTADSQTVARQLLIDSMLHIDKFNIGTAKDLILRAIDMLEKTD